MSNFKLYSVNWQDGMLLSEQHLREQQEYLEELIRWQGIRTGDQYGLVMKSDRAVTPLKMAFTRSGNQIRVEVLECQAITPDGSIVEISQEQGNTLVIEQEIRTDIIDVYLAVERTSKKQVGDPDPDETVPRMPYLVNNYILLLESPTDRAASSCVQIARLNVSGSAIDYASDYYAPCVNVASEERLLTKVKEQQKQLDSLMSSVWQAYRAASLEGAADKGSDLQSMIKSVILSFGMYLTSSFDSFVTGQNSGHPLQVQIYFKRLFRTISALLNLEPAVKDYLNERFFNKELNQSLAQFTSEVDSFLWAEYNHQNIGNHITTIDVLMSHVTKLMMFLAESKKITADIMLPPSVTYQGRTFALVKSGERCVEKRGDLSYLMISITESIKVNDLMFLITKDLLSDSQWTSLNIRMSANDALSLGETDPASIDVTTFGNKVAITAQDMFRSSSMSRANIIIRNFPDLSSFDALGPSDLGVYVL